MTDLDFYAVTRGCTHPEPTAGSLLCRIFLQEYQYIISCLTNGMQIQRLSCFSAYCSWLIGWLSSLLAYRSLKPSCVFQELRVKQGILNLVYSSYHGRK
jgi:hypothetical protein